MVYNLYRMKVWIVKAVVESCDEVHVFVFKNCPERDEVWKQIFDTLLLDPDDDKSVDWAWSYEAWSKEIIENVTPNSVSRVS